jgi:diguanylate cyclase (GGDEF)-like protein/PAS domain S-box-containing protein
MNREAVLVPATALAIGLALAGSLLAVLVAAGSLRAARRERQARALLAAREAERELADRARRAAEERARLLAETSTDVVCVLSPGGALRHVSAAAREVLGREPESLLGKPYEELVHPDDLDGMRAASAAGHGGAAPFSLRHRLARGDGSWVWTETRVRLLRDPSTGRVVEMHATVRDVEHRVQAERALEEAEKRFRTAFEAAPIGMALASPDFRFERVNEALCAMTGYPRDQLEGFPLASIADPEDVRADWERRTLLLEGELDAFRAETRFVHARGQLLWVDASWTLVRDDAGRPAHFLVQMQDITERRRHEAELRHQADHDPLTGLRNRRAFERELERHLAHVDRYGPRGAAILLDVDHFKTINDTLGHSAGDELIVRVGHALRDRLRDSDVLARLGGDEFAILLPEATAEEAHTVAGAILEAVRSERVPAAGARERAVTASLGLALFADGDALANADHALYDAKEAGRDRWAAYAPDGLDGTRVEVRSSWAELVRGALAEDRFVLHAQPIVELATGATEQYELLLRMHTPDGQLVAPATFLPVAERFDLMGAVDRWVVTRAVRLLAEQAARGHALTAEVNLSGGSTRDPELLAVLERELSAGGVEPHRLVFEVAETIAVGDIPRTRTFAQKLAGLGCRFALDDFGAGSGSLYHLKHLPFDYLKLDGEFIRRCADDPTDRLVVEAVVGIARGLGRRLIAEHVGDEETVALLARLGVDLAQGHHLGSPRPLEAWLDGAREAVAALAA